MLENHMVVNTEDESVKCYICGDVQYPCYFKKVQGKNLCEHCLDDAYEWAKEQEDLNAYIYSEFIRNKGR